MNLFLWMLVQWTFKMCPFHTSKIFFGDKYTLMYGFNTNECEIELSPGFWEMQWKYLYRVAQ